MKNFLTTEWRNLALANYEVDPSILKPYLPAGTELDINGGKCFVTLIGFVFANLRIAGLKIPAFQKFEEVNVRFYVKHTSGNEERPGVVFLREMANRHLLTLFANSVFFENYRTVSMKHDIITGSEFLHTAYSWKMDQLWQTFSVESGKEPKPVDEGSEEDYIIHRYFAYSAIDDNRTIEHRISHPRWNIYPVKNVDVKADFGWIINDDFRFLNQQQPYSVLLADGSPVEALGQRVLSF